MKQKRVVFQPGPTLLFFYFYLNIWFRARKFTGPFEKRAPGLLWEYCQQSMCLKACKICILLCLERTWEWGCHLEYSIHSKELGSILLHHLIKKYWELAFIRLWIHSIFKNFHSGGQIKKVADSSDAWLMWTEAVSGKKNLLIQKYPDTCERGLREVADVHYSPLWWWIIM